MPNSITKHILQSIRKSILSRPPISQFGCFETEAGHIIYFIDFHRINKGPDLETYHFNFSNLHNMHLGFSRSGTLNELLSFCSELLKNPENLDDYQYLCISIIETFCVYSNELR